MILREKQQNRRRNAFTLMEMMVVVAIVVALAGLGGFYVMGQLNEAKKDTAKVQCKNLAVVCTKYMMDHGTLPGSFDVLKQGTPDKPPYLEKDAIIVDPWNQPYQMETLGTGQVNVFSNGPPGGQRIN